MSRIPGAEQSKQGFLSGFFTRFVYALTRRKLGRVVMPVQVTAHHPKSSGATDRWSSRCSQAAASTLRSRTSRPCVWQPWLGVLFESTSGLRSADRTESPRKSSKPCLIIRRAVCSLRPRSLFSNMPRS